MTGEVITEIAEELFEDERGNDDQMSKMPPVENGVYSVMMRLKKDLPNWVPMYGRKVCLDYKGIKKQCNSCYGPHIKKYCKNERLSIEEFAEKFRLKHPNVPEQYYGRLAKIENINEQRSQQMSTNQQNNAIKG